MKNYLFIKRSAVSIFSLCLCCALNCESNVLSYDFGGLISLKNDKAIKDAIEARYKELGNVPQHLLYSDAGKKFVGDFIEALQKISEKIGNEQQLQCYEDGLKKYLEDIKSVLSKSQSEREKYCQITDSLRDNIGAFNGTIVNFGTISGDVTNALNNTAEDIVERIQTADGLGLLIKCGDIARFKQKEQQARDKAAAESIRQVLQYGEASVLADAIASYTTIGELGAELEKQRCNVDLKGCTVQGIADAIRLMQSSQSI